MPACADILEPRKSRLELLKYAFNVKKNRMQVVLAYLQSFCRSLLLQCLLQPKSVKSSLKTSFWGIYGRSRSSTLICLKSPSPVLLMIGNMYVPICNRFHATRANSSKITTFTGEGTPLTPACVGLFELRKSRLGLLKSMFNAENFICRLSGSISSHFGAIHS